jgi:hypothetical protein
VIAETNFIISGGCLRLWPICKVEGLQNMTITPVQQPRIPDQPTGVKKNAQQSKAAEPSKDSVHLSSAALAALLAKPAEATETFVQTIKETATGDLKAQAILAKK